MIVCLKDRKKYLKGSSSWVSVSSSREINTEGTYYFAWGRQSNVKDVVSH